MAEEWILENADGSEYVIEPDDWSLDRYYDEGTIRSSEATLQVSRKVPASDKQWIRMIDGGATRFLGYISRRPTISGITKKTIRAIGAEALLMNCPCPPISIPYDSIDISGLFSDSTYPGLIYAANSHIPPGWLEDTLPAETTDDWISHGPGVVIDTANAIAKFKNLGTRSRIGTNIICVNGIDYVDQASYALMAANYRSTYRDLNDLYIHFSYYISGGVTSIEHGYKFLPIFALNAFDTRCRVGSIESTYEFATPISVGPENMAGKYLVDAATAHGLNVRPRYAGKLCYIDALEDFEDSDGIFSIHEDACEEIRFREPSESPYDSLTGMGAGSRLFRQSQSIMTTTPGCAFVRGQTEFLESYFDDGGNLCPLTTAKWQSTRPRRVVEIRTRHHKYIPLGSSIQPIIIGEAASSYQLKHIGLSMGQPAVLELGVRSLDILDAMDAVDSQGNDYTESILPALIEEDTLTGTLTVGATNKAEVAYDDGVFDLPAWADVEDYNPRVLMDIDLSVPSGAGTPKPYNSTAKLIVFVSSDDSFTNSEIVHEASTPNYVVLSDDLLALDITRKCTFGATNYFKISVVLNGALPSASDDSDLKISVKVYMVPRRAIL